MFKPTMTHARLDRDMEHFQSLSWTRQLLQDQNYITVRTPSREPKESTEDAMFAETLNSRNAVRACLTLKKKPSSDKASTTEARLLLSLGYGVNGWPNVLHGGVVGLLIDEAMGTLLQMIGKESKGAISKYLVTAYLKTTYIRPIPTPSAIMITAKLGEIEGRKIRVNAVVEGEGGDAMATGEALWVSPKERQTKL